MPLQKLPCARCGERTAQLKLLVQIYGPEERTWESIFTLCVSCLQLERYALNHVNETVYCTTERKPPTPNRLEDGVIACLLIRGPEKAGAIQRYLRVKIGMRLNRHETEHLLRLMMEKRLIGTTKKDWTEKVIEELAGSKKVQQTCPKCGTNKVSSLYAQIRDQVTRVEKKGVVGSFCPSCRSYLLLDAQGLLKRFVKGFAG